MDWGMDCRKPLRAQSQWDFGRYRQAVCALHWSPENTMLMTWITIELDVSPHLLDYAGSLRAEGLNNGQEMTPVHWWRYVPGTTRRCLLTWRFGVTGVFGHTWRVYTRWDGEMSLISHRILHPCLTKHTWYNDYQEAWGNSWLLSWKSTDIYWYWRTKKW